jgi:hypothetical protein
MTITQGTKQERRKQQPFAWDRRLQRRQQAKGPYPGLFLPRIIQGGAASRVEFNRLLAIKS